jgi:hypothetical protein
VKVTLTWVSGSSSSISANGQSQSMTLYAIFSPQH